MQWCSNQLLHHLQHQQSTSLTPGLILPLSRLSCCIWTEKTENYTENCLKFLLWKGPTTKTYRYGRWPLNLHCYLSEWVCALVAKNDLFWLYICSGYFITGCNIHGKWRDRKRALFVYFLLTWVTLLTLFWWLLRDLYYRSRQKSCRILCRDKKKLLIT